MSVWDVCVGVRTEAAAIESESLGECRRQRQRMSSSHSQRAFPCTNSYTLAVTSGFDSEFQCFEWNSDFHPPTAAMSWVKWCLTHSFLPLNINHKFAVGNVEAQRRRQLMCRVRTGSALVPSLFLFCSDLEAPTFIHSCVIQQDNSLWLALCLEPPVKILGLWPMWGICSYPWWHHKGMGRMMRFPKGGLVLCCSISTLWLLVK